MDFHVGAFSKQADVLPGIKHEINRDQNIQMFPQLRVHVTLRSSPPLGAPVLEPGLDLRVGHLQGLGQGGALRRGQVLLAVEAFLQLTHLQAREGRARLLLLRRRPVLVRVTYTTRHSQG